MTAGWAAEGSSPVPETSHRTPKAAKMLKSRLQEYTQNNSLPLPVNDTANDGVTVNATKYDPPQRFKYKKEPENAAAQTTIEDLLKQGLNLQIKETRWNQKNAAYEALLQDKKSCI